MSQPQLREAGDGLDPILDHVRRVADMIGLRDWTFEVQIGPLPDGLRAKCDCVGGRAFARITVTDGFFRLLPDEQNEALVHETIHPLLHPLMEHVLDLRDYLGRAHFETVERVFLRDLERVVDALTSTVASAVEPPRC